MANLLATAFVTVKMLGSGIGSDLTKELDGATGAATASGTKAGKGFAKGFQESGVMKASQGITLGLAAVGAESVKAAATFQAAMTRISTQAGVPQSKLAALSKGILALAGTTGAGPDALADSLYHVESNFASLGITAPKALNLVKVAAEGAAVGNANLEDVTNALTAAVASGIPGVSNMSQAMGALNSIVGAGDMKMQDLADAFGTGMLATVKGFGLSLKDVGAALDVFGDNNIRGAKAGTDLRMAIQALASPGTGPVAQAALASLGLTANTLAKDMQSGGLIKAMDDLSARMVKAGDTGSKVGGVITDAFGKRAGTGLNILLSQMDRLQSKYPALDKGATDFGKAWAQTSATPAQQFKELEASAEALGISLGTKLLPYVMQLVGWLRQNQDAVEKGAVGVAAFAVAMTGLGVAIKAVSAIKNVFSVISGGVGGLVTAGKAIGSISSTAITAAGAQKLLAVNTAALATTTGAFTVTLDGQVVATEAATAAAGELSLAEKGAAVAGGLLEAVNPFAWVAAATVAVAALGVVLVRNSNQTGDLISQYSEQDKAVGFNISGYQKLAAQLGTVNDGQSKLSQTVRLSEGGVELARDGAAAYSIALGEVTTAQTGAQKMAANLVTGLNVLASSYGITRTQAEQVAAKAGVTATQFAAAGNAGQLSQQKVFKWGNTAGQATIQADQLADATGGITTALTGLSNKLEAGQGGLLGYQSAAVGMTQALQGSTTGLQGNSAAAVTARGATLQATIQALNFASAQSGLHGNVKLATEVLQDQVNALQKTGDKSSFVTTEIGDLQTALDKLKSKSLTINVSGTGEYEISQNYKSLSSKTSHGAAAGWMVTGGTPNRDSVPIMAMPGELVVPKSIVGSGAVDHLRGSIPGFAAGGIVPTYSGAPGAAMGAWAQNNVNASALVIAQAVAAAAAPAIKAAMAAATATYGAGPGGGAPSANARLAQSLMPSWASGAEWSAWNAVAMRESGWSQYARNPGSGAYGIPQALPASKMGAAANPPQSNPAAQIKWMIGYIQGRYHDPIGAEAHEQGFGWYAKGAGKGGAASGWGVVGEHGKELVNFSGGEHVLPADMTSKILTGKMSLPGYATGTLTPAQKLKNQRLAELAADVTKDSKLTKARNTAITNRTLAIDAQLLADLQHPKDKNGPKKVASLRKALSSYETTSGKPISLLHQEIGLLRALTGNPTALKYGGAGPAPSTSTDDSSTDDSSSTDSSTASSAASTAVSAAQSAAAIAAWAQGISGSAIPSSSVSLGSGSSSPGLGSSAGPSGGGISPGSPWQFGGSGPVVASPVGAQGDPVTQQLLGQLIAAVRAGPGQNTAGMRAVMSGTVTGARQRGRYRTR